MPVICSSRTQIGWLSHEVNMIFYHPGELLPCGEVQEARGQPVPPEEDGRRGRQVD